MAKEHRPGTSTLSSKVHRELKEKEKNELTFKPKINKTIDNEN